MTEIPKNFDEYEELFSFDTPLDTVGVWIDPEGYKIEMTDGRRDAYYLFTTEEVVKMNKLMNLPEGQDFIESLKQLVAADRGEEFRKALVAEFKTEYFWISGF